MIKLSAYIRFIFNADDISTAQNIFNDLSSRLDIVQNSVTELIRYEDDNHFEISLAVKIGSKNTAELELKAFRLCTEIVKGPWLFLNLPDKKNGFEFEAIYNHEAFILPSFEYMNRLKWAHLEVAQ